MTPRPLHQVPQVLTFSKQECSSNSTLNIVGQEKIFASLAFRAHSIAYLVSYDLSQEHAVVFFWQMKRIRPTYLTPKFVK